MKNILTTFCLITCVSFGFAQSLKFSDNTNKDVTNTTITVGVSANEIKKVHFKIENPSPIKKTLKVSRKYLNVLDTAKIIWFGADCWHSVFNPAVIVTNDFGEIDANTILPQNPACYGLSPYYEVASPCAEADTEYKIWGVGITGDTATIKIHYACTLGIKDGANANNILSNPFPNPAHSLVSIKYDVSGFSQNNKITILNILGKMVTEIISTDKKGIATIDVSDLSAGIYFYNLVINNQAVITRKLIITSK